LRILPLAWLVIGIVALITNEWRGAVWYATYLVNWLPDHQAPRELAHYWSLAVEEQFYFLWPLLVFGLSRAGLVRVCLAIIALATIARAVLLLWRPDFATLHFLGNATILRADPLAAGAILAVLARAQPLAKVRRQALRLCVIGMIGAIILLSLSSTAGYRAVAYVLQEPVIALAFATALLLVLVDSPGWLKARWLVRLGTISYGVYVIHGCISALLRAQIEMPLIRAGVLLLVSVLAAEISWRLFESPLLAFKSRWPMPRRAHGPVPNA
jgi:peptidoglycan/LPS O-acetylase OafA/YrhL